MAITSSEYCLATQHARLGDVWFGGLKAVNHWRIPLKAHGICLILLISNSQLYNFDMFVGIFDLWESQLSLTAREWNPHRMGCGLAQDVYLGRFACRAGAELDPADLSGWRRTKPGDQQIRWQNCWSWNKTTLFRTFRHQEQNWHEWHEWTWLFQQKSANLLQRPEKQHRCHQHQGFSDFFSV